jgi:cysteine desulfuration protein SufE
MFESCIKKQNQVKALFDSCANDEERYKKIIELGRRQQHLAITEKIPENIVKGCQSTVYLTSHLKDGLVYFAFEADALVSAGLAEILVEAYSGESPEVILKCPPNYLEELGLQSSLSPNRANGLYSVHLRMKQDALKLLISRGK